MECPLILEAVSSQQRRRPQKECSVESEPIADVLEDPDETAENDVNLLDRQRTPDDDVLFRIRSM